MRVPLPIASNQIGAVLFQKNKTYVVSTVRSTRTNAALKTPLIGPMNPATTPPINPEKIARRVPASSWSGVLP